MQEINKSLTAVGFFIVPCLGVFIDLYGNRITLSKPLVVPNILGMLIFLVAIFSAGVFLAMALVNWAPTTQETAAAFVCLHLLRAFNAFLTYLRWWHIH